MRRLVATAEVDGWPVGETLEDFTEYSMAEGTAVQVH